MDLYHALNRGVDKRAIFLDDRDRARFVHDMYEFNSTERAINSGRSCPTNTNTSTRTTTAMIDVGRQSLERGGDQIVSIHGWCLMDNHYHLLLSPRVENGLSLFLKKLNGGYAKYFNERYVRSGALFQGKTKKIQVENDSHFLHILNYIHLNPLDREIRTKAWRQGNLNNVAAALQLLGSYRWSSYRDYAGIKNFPSILTTSLFEDVFEHAYAKKLEKYLSSMKLSEIQHLFLEKEA